jgi:hypothetical protein
MLGSGFVYSIPLGALGLIVAAVALLSVEFGWRLGYRRHQRAKDQGESSTSTPISAAVGATMGLLAFLLAFTFSMAASRFDTRKQVVLQEANAIGTAYLRTDFLAGQPRGEARRLLSEYLALRAGGASVVKSPEGMAKSAALQNQLWAIAAGAQPGSYTAGLFVQSVNEVIDLDTERVTANRNQIPDSIWLMLGVVTVFSMVALGYEFGLTGARNWAVTLLLVIVFTTVIVLIADLDTPQAGLLQVSQQPLIDLQNSIGTPAP